METFPQRLRLLHLGNGRRGHVAADPTPLHPAPGGHAQGAGAEAGAGPSRGGAGGAGRSPGPAWQVGPLPGRAPPALPRARGRGAGEPGSGATPPPADAPSASCARTFSRLVLSRGAAVDLEPGRGEPSRDLRASAGPGAERTVPDPARSPLPLPLGVRRGQRHKLSALSPHRALGSRSRGP